MSVRLSSYAYVERSCLTTSLIARFAILDGEGIEECIGCEEREGCKSVVKSAVEIGIMSMSASADGILGMKVMRSSRGVREVMSMEVKVEVIR